VCVCVCVVWQVYDGGHGHGLPFLSFSKESSSDSTPKITDTTRGTFSRQLIESLVPS
jgi:hypothetical protein